MVGLAHPGRLFLSFSSGLSCSTLAIYLSFCLLLRVPRATEGILPLPEAVSLDLDPSQAIGMLSLPPYW